MIACYSKDISLVKSNQWTHLFHPDVYWFAWYKNKEGKLRWGIGTDRNKTILDKDVPLETMEYEYIIDLGVWEHFDQKVQCAKDATIWVNLDTGDIQHNNKNLYTIAAFKYALKNLGISSTLTKCTKFYAMSKEEKMEEVRKLQKLIEELNTPLPEIPSLYEELMKKPIKFTITKPTYS